MEIVAGEFFRRALKLLATAMREWQRLVCTLRTFLSLEGHSVGPDLALRPFRTESPHAPPSESCTVTWREAERSRRYADRVAVAKCSGPIQEANNGDRFGGRYFRFGCSELKACDKIIWRLE